MNNEREGSFFFSFSFFFPAKTSLSLRVCGVFESIGLRSCVFEQFFWKMTCPSFAVSIYHFFFQQKTRENDASSTTNARLREGVCYFFDRIRFVFILEYWEERFYYFFF